MIIGYTLDNQALQFPLLKGVFIHGYTTPRVYHSAIRPLKGRHYLTTCLREGSWLDRTKNCSSCMHPQFTHITRFRNPTTLYLHISTPKHMHR